MRKPIIETPKREITLGAIGPPGNGKSTAVCAISQFLLGLTGRGRIRQSNKAFREQLKRIRDGLEVQKTDPDSPERFVFDVPSGDLTIVVTCYAGEVLEEAGTIESLVTAYHSDISLIVMNPFCFNKEIAFRSLSGMMVKLMSPALGFPFHEALIHSIQQIFGKERDYVESSIRARRNINRIESCQIAWDPLAGKGSGAIKFNAIKTRIQGLNLTSVQIKKALQRMCDGMVDGQLDLPVIRRFVEANPNTIVGLSRCDLLPFIPTVDQGDLDSVFDLVFDVTDRRVSQQVKLVNYNVVIEPFELHPEPIYVDSMAENAGRDLWHAVEMQIKPFRESSDQGWLRNWLRRFGRGRLSASNGHTQTIH